ncbi:hypothetical protein M662_15480 [Bacillus sp. SB49]|uniref:hypothetical protein n=1 Tax=Bacillaceae TaxID=186817 RepID=UPI000407FB44|nr:MULTISPECIES: hypothetical protein [Bacillaceae]QHT47825.1 hypothetical protein M662_15480 [Bacillus sp. SB49]
MKNVLSKKAITGALALAIAIPGVAFAATSDSESGESAFETEVRELLQQFKSGDITEDEAVDQLKEQGFHRGGHGFEALDEETKAKVDAIRDQVEAGEMTEEEARDQMEALGLKGPHHGKGGFMENLTDEQKQVMEEVRDQVEAGTMTKEEADARLEEAGIDLPDRPDMQDGTDPDETEVSQTTAL